MKYKIYQPAKSSMQSGLYSSKKWCLETMDVWEKKLSPTFGWTTSSNTNDQVKLFFDKLEDAVHFAEKNNFSYKIFESKKRKILKKTYADNFRPKKS